MSHLNLSSPAFAAEDWIPDCCSGYGEDVSPELWLDNIAENAVSMALTLDDLGHPIQPGYNHWLAWNLPPLARIPAALPRGPVNEQPFHMEQGLAYGKHRYRGPKPPFHWNHRYCFTVYILDTVLVIPPESRKTDLLNAMAGHILQTARLYGKYQRKHTGRRCKTR